MKNITATDLAELVIEIMHGKTIVFPTESSYGLGCDAANQAAVDTIFKIKGRGFDKPLLVVVPSVAEAKKYLVWNSALEYLATNYWPGPLTIVGEYSGGNLAKGVVSTAGTVAVRVTAHPFVAAVTSKLERPLVATSANLAGEGEIYEAQRIIESFSEQEFQPDVFVDYGDLTFHKPTTLISVVDGGCTILRQGELYVDTTKLRLA